MIRHNVSLGEAQTTFFFGNKGLTGGELRRMEAGCPDIALKQLMIM